MIVLRSGCVTAEIEEMGAEIKSLKLDAEEFMWNKKDFWPKTSPVLFPFVGGLEKVNTYMKVLNILCLQDMDLREIINLK